jgi:hypothetical protein
MAPKSTDYVQFKLRVRRSLLNKIQREAEKKKHSANTEAVARLEDSFVRSEQARRDSAIIDMLVDHDSTNSDLLRQIAAEMIKHPDAFHSEPEFKSRITRMHFAAFVKDMTEREAAGELPDHKPDD